MPALLEICPKDVKEQMTNRLDEIGDNYENVMPKVVPYTTNKTEQARGGQEEMYVPMEVDRASGNEAEDDCENVDNVRRRSTCFQAGGWDTSRGIVESQGKGKGRDGSKGHAEGSGQYDD